MLQAYTETHTVTTVSSKTQPSYCTIGNWWLGVVAIEVTLGRAQSVLGWVTVWAGIPSRYVTSQLGQLSLASLRGR